MPDANMTLSQVIESYSGIRSASRLDAFLGSSLAVFCVSESLGPVLGWPTITGQIYSFFGFEDKAPGLLQMLLVLFVQLLTCYLAGHRLWRTSWPAWIVARARRIPTISLPEPNKRETSLGVLAGIVATAILSALLGYLPSHRLPLVKSEIIVILVSCTAIILALIFPPKAHYPVAHPDDVVFERISLAPSPVEITLSQTQFQKSILLRRMPNHYEPCSLVGPIRLDFFEHVLINYGVYEKNISTPVTVMSANVFQCEGMFSLDVHPPAQGEDVRFDSHGVEVLINNLYTQADFLHFLTERLTLAMHSYAGVADSEVKTLTENFSLKSLRSELETSHGFRNQPQSIGAALNPAAARISQLEVIRKRIEHRLAMLDEYQRAWQKARQLQEQAAHRLPVVFEQQLQQFFTDKLRGGQEAAAHATILRLLRWARVRFFVSRFDFTAAAVRAESHLEAERNEIRTELKKVEQQITDDTSLQAVEMRSMLRAKADSIDPRLMMTPRGCQLFEAIARLLLLDNHSVLQQGGALLAASVDIGVPGQVTESTAVPPKARAPIDAKVPAWLQSQRDARSNQERASTTSSRFAKDPGSPVNGSNTAPSRTKGSNDEPF